MKATNFPKWKIYKHVNRFSLSIMVIIFRNIRKMDLFYTESYHFINRIKEIVWLNSFNFIMFIFRSITKTSNVYQYPDDMKLINDTGGCHFIILNSKSTYGSFPLLKIETHFPCVIYHFSHPYNFRSLML